MKVTDQREKIMGIYEDPITYHFYLVDPLPLFEPHLPYQ